MHKGLETQSDLTEEPADNHFPVVPAARCATTIGPALSELSALVRHDVSRRRNGRRKGEYNPSFTTSSGGIRTNRSLAKRRYGRWEVPVHRGWGAWTVDRNGHEGSDAPKALLRSALSP